MTSGRRDAPPRRRSHEPRLLGAAMAALLLGGCGAAGTGAGDAAPQTRPVTPPSSSPSTTSEPTPTPTLPPATAWSAGPGEVQPEIKLAATRFLETVGTWRDGAGDVASAEDRLMAAGIDPALAAQTAELVDDGAVAASVAVVYPQYGGLTTTAASVMTAVTQTVLGPDGGRVERQLTLDVRLSRAPADGSWSVTAVSPDPQPPAPGGTSPAAQKVLDNTNVRLPGAAVRDVEEGRVDASLLTILDGLGQDHVLDVLLLTTGHPTNVFNTDRASNHSIGRAVDVWRIDGHVVADPATPRPLIEQVMREAAALGATEVGAPFDLNGNRPGFFTDLVHRDHLHVGVSPDKPPATP